MNTRKITDQDRKDAQLAVQEARLRAQGGSPLLVQCYLEKLMSPTVTLPQLRDGIETIAKIAGMLQKDEEKAAAAIPMIRIFKHGSSTSITIGGCETSPSLSGERVISESEREIFDAIPVHIKETNELVDSDLLVEFDDYE